MRFKRERRSHSDRTSTGFVGEVVVWHRDQRVNGLLVDRHYGALRAKEYFVRIYALKDRMRRRHMIADSKDVVTLETVFFDNGGKPIEIIKEYY